MTEGSEQKFSRAMAAVATQLERNISELKVYVESGEPGDRDYFGPVLTSREAVLSAIRRGETAHWIEFASGVTIPASSGANTDTVRWSWSQEVLRREDARLPGDHRSS